MIPPTKRFYNPNVDERVAEVAVQAAADRELHLVRIARGKTTAQLREVALHGPYPEEELAARFAEAVADLRTEDFWPSGLQTLLATLDAPQPLVRARAATRLGWRRSPEAVDKLLAGLPNSVDESCAYLDALGAIGDARAVPALREYATRKLLSRRRSAVEALHQLGDAQGLADAERLARERLPQSVRTSLDSAQASSAPGAHLDALVQAILALDLTQKGQALDTLYELAMPVTVEALRQVLAQTKFAQAHIWRGVKSILKRSMLRHDYATFGWLNHAIELQGRSSKGITATVKSGYDGQQRQTTVFSRGTQTYVRRLCWRYLRNLANHRPEAYPYAAAEALIHYAPGEDSSFGFAHSYLLHRILWGQSKRFCFMARSMTFRPIGRGRKAKEAVPDVREEAFPELWDAQPRAYLRVLGAARLPEAHVVAVRGIAAHPRVLLEASHAEIVALLQAPHDPTVQIGLRELERRFDPNHPDWALLRQLLTDERPNARTLGQRWLRLTAHLWLRDTEQVLRFLAIPHPNLQALVVEMLSALLAEDKPYRQTLAERVALLLRGPEPRPGAYNGYAQLAQEALTEELGALLSVTELAEWIARAAPAVKALAAHLLRRRPEAVSELGLERLAALAAHEIASVRAAAHSLIRSAVLQLRQDPSLLFVLTESDWEDTRALALELLRDRIGLESLGLDGLTGLLDSNRPEVQKVGQELALRHAADLPMADLVPRLVEHPAPGMRRFALELAAQHLPRGDRPLAEMKNFCRAALFDLWPDRRVKRLVIDFLTARGLEDARQAEVAATILGDVVRVQGRSDFEHALQALVRLQLAYPELKTTVRITAGGLA